MAGPGQAGPGDFKVVLDGESARLEAAFKRAEERAGKFADGVEKKLEKVDNSISGLVKRATSLAKGLGITAGIGVAVSAYNELTKAATEAVEALAKIGRDARSTGLSTDMFQSLEFGAVQAGSRVDALSQSLQQYARVIGEAKMGQGALFGALRDTNPLLLEQLIRSKSQSDALRILADALQRAGSAQAKLALASQAFGGGAAEMIRILDGGAGALDRITAKAKEFGYVIDGTLIKEAEQVEIRFKTMAAVFDRNIKAALVELAPLLVDTSEWAIKLAGSINLVADAFRSLERKSTAGLLARRDELKGMVERLQASANDPRGIGASFFGAIGVLSSDAEVVEQRLARVRGLQNEIVKIDQQLRLKAHQSSEFGPAGGDLGLDKLDEARAAAAKENPWKAEIYNDSRYDQAADKLASLHKRMLQETKQTRALIEAEHAEELKTFDEMLADKLISQEQYEQARQDLAEITARRMAEVAREEMRMVEETAQVLSSTVQNIFDEFVRGGEMSAESFKEILHSLLADMARLALQKAVLEPMFGGGSTQGAGLFGQLLTGFQGGFASGGDFAAGKPMLVGEKGPELLIPKQAGTIIPNGAGLGGGPVTVVTNIDARGAYPESVEEIKRAIAKRDADLPGRILSTVRDGQQRRVLR